MAKRRPAGKRRRSRHASATSPPRPARNRTTRTELSLEARLLAAVGPMMRIILAHARRRQTWSELTYEQYSILRVLDVYGPSATVTISRFLMVAGPSITRTSKGLVDAGLVERSRHPKDGRAVLLELTPVGRRRVRGMRRELLSIIHGMLDPLPVERRAALASAFDELTGLLESHSWEASSRDGLEGMR